MYINCALLGFYLCYFLEGINVLKDLIVYDQNHIKYFKKILLNI